MYVLYKSFDYTNIVLFNRLLIYLTCSLLMVICYFHHQAVMMSCTMKLLGCIQYLIIFMSYVSIYQIIHFTII